MKKAFATLICALGLGYQGSMFNDLILRTSIAFYDSVAGESDISMSLVSVGVIKSF
jgi:hypothetical protein